MRIGMDARKAWDGGIGRYIRNLLEGLLSEEEISLIHVWMKPDSEPFCKAVARFQPHIETARLYGIWEQVSLARRIGRIPIDLFHAPHYVVPFSKKVPLVVTIHDVIHLVFSRSLLHRTYAYSQVRYAVARARAVITPSEFSRRELLRVFPNAGEKIVTIPHGLEATFFEDLTREEMALKAELALPEQYLLYVGNHKPHKNLTQLLEVCKRLFEEIPELVLCLTGDEGEEGGLVARTVIRLGLEGKVRFLGHLDNTSLRVCYRNARCFVFPSVYEGFGFPPLEAMASRVPVVAFRVASLPEVVGDGGILVPPRDGRAFYEAVLSLLRDAEKRRTWIERGYIRARKFTWERAVKSHLQVYRHALSVVPV